MMTLKQFEIGFSPSLKEIAMIHIAKRLYHSPEIVELAQKICPVTVKESQCHRYIMSSYIYGELNEVQYNSLFNIFSMINNWVEEYFDLPQVLKIELKQIVILTGKYMFMINGLNFFASNERLYEKDKRDCYVLLYEQIFNKKCFNVRIRDNICYWDRSVRIGFFNYICMRVPDENAVAKYHDVIIWELLDIQREIGFINSDITKKVDVVFNTICIWNYLYLWNKKIPGHYIQSFNTYNDFVIPLDECVDFISIYSARYFSTKLLGFGLPFSVVPKILKKMLDSGILMLLNPANWSGRRCLCSGAESEDPCKEFLYVINLFEKSIIFQVFQDYINEVVIFFLRVWPYYQLVPKILDFSYKNSWKLNHRFLLQSILHLIGNEKKQDFKVNQTFYLEMFKKVWSEAPEEVKLSFTINRINNLAIDQVKHPIFKSWDEDFKNGKTFDELIAIKWKSLSEKEKIEDVTNFVSQLDISTREVALFWNDILDCKTHLHSSFYEYQFQFEQADVLNPN